MTTQNIGLFKALAAKMDFLNQRQRVISQNIANSDTPNFKPSDLKKVDFGTVLKDVTNGKGVEMVSTSAMHIPMGGEITDPKSANQKTVYEVAPDKNAVIMEEQLIKAGQTMMDYNLMTSLYQKQVRMIQTAIGAR
jgi:flagellar basal-body rod protein FlgB